MSELDEEYWEDSYDLDALAEVPQNPLPPRLPEVPQSPLPPRLPVDVAKFFDLEAVVDADEEDEDVEPEDLNFIDDGDNVSDTTHSSGQKPVWPALGNQEHQEFVELANSIRKRYRKRVTLPENSLVDTPLPILEFLPTIHDAPIFAIRVPRGKEEFILQCMFQVSIARNVPVSSIFTRDDVPGRIYIETKSPESISTLTSPFIGVSRPRLVDLTSRLSLLNLGRVPQRVKPGWGRMRRTRMREPVVPPERQTSDLVFIISVDFNEGTVEALVQRIIRDDQKDNDKKCMVIEFFSPMDIIQPGLPPTVAELDYFRRRFPRNSGVPDLYSQQVFAFGPADAFVVPAQEWILYNSDGQKKTSFDGYWGRILAVRDVQSVPMAACVRDINFDTFKVVGRVQFIPVCFLRYSFFRETRELAVMDRVIVCIGNEHCGCTGRVVDVSADCVVNVALASAGPGETVSIPMSMLQICFLCGDCVDIVSGEYEGKAGIVVGGQLGGFWTVYIPDDFRPLSITVSVHALRFSPPSGGDPVTQTKADAVKVLGTSGLLFTGKAFEGRQVRVVGGVAHFQGREFKGKTGQVIGCTVAASPPNKNTKDPLPLEAESMLLLRNLKNLWRDATLQVRLHHSAQIIQVDIKHVQDTNTFLPLLQSIHVPWTKPPRPISPPRPVTPPPVALSQDPAWRDPSSSLTALQRTITELETGQSNGQWLSHPALQMKRIDVVIDTTFVPPFWANRWPKELASAGGRTGHIVITPAFQPRKQKIIVKIDPLGFNLYCPVENLRPQRTLYIPFLHEGRECISTTSVRVLIIGCDTAGSLVEVGCYARTVPDTLLEGSLEVMFPVDAVGNAPPKKRFPLVSLCRSLNRQPLGYEEFTMTSKFFYMHPKLDADIL
ncbi:hypothetical protein R3P38DRAFT_2916686 [Favolaschia claudopus]|uniref:NGN domain-containing protein n=1 Tax=Favolaschia claudopus TaxID=2862362 RepID=A0AAW0C4H2_9AGAR